MTDHEASRTLVKSPPELWAECSDAASLARHLGQIGEIRITRLEPETTVAWEGEEVSGTVRLEPTGWGTKVILTTRRPATDEPPPGGFEAAAANAEPEAEPVAEAEPVVASPDTLRSSRRGAFERLREYFGLGRARQQAVPAPEPPPAPMPGPTDPALAQPPEPPAATSPDAVPTAPETPPSQDAALTAALDSLGQAHHRPFSRG